MYIYQVPMCRIFGDHAFDENPCLLSVIRYVVRSIRRGRFASTHNPVMPNKRWVYCFRSFLLNLLLSNCINECFIISGLNRVEVSVIKANRFGDPVASSLSLCLKYVPCILRAKREDKHNTTLLRESLT